MKKLLIALVVFVMTTGVAFAQTPGTYKYIIQMKPKQKIPDTVLVLKYRKNPGAKSFYTIQSLHRLFDLT